MKQLLSSVARRLSTSEALIRPIAFAADYLMTARGCLFTFHRGASAQAWEKLPNRDFYLDLDFLDQFLTYLTERGWQVVTMEEALHHVTDFTIVPGKMVLEARLKGITKGTALRAFMREEPFLGRTPIFIGDDKTDEDAFIAAQDLGGVGIKLGEGETAARMRIANVASVHALLQGLGDIAARDRAEALSH